MLSGWNLLKQFTDSNTRLKEPRTSSAGHIGLWAEFFLFRRPFPVHTVLSYDWIISKILYMSHTAYKTISWCVSARMEEFFAMTVKSASSWDWGIVKSHQASKNWHKCNYSDNIAFMESIVCQAVTRNIMETNEVCKNCCEVMHWTAKHKTTF